MSDNSEQFGRRGSLLLVEGEKALDLSDLHFTFKTSQNDVESPSNCAIRVHNLSADTVKKIKGEFSRVVLQAGYGNNFGVIFDGTIRQFGEGREPGATDTYLDLLAADGDLAYNYATINKTLAAGSKPEDRISAAISSMKDTSASITPGYLMASTGGVLPRGKVLFGMARAVLRQEARSQGATWNINNGKVNVVPLDGYLPGEAVVLNAQTGMIGMPQQTINGIETRCLLNPKLVIGGLVKIDNKSINQILQRDPKAGPIAYNQYAGLQLLAHVSADGIYRLFVIEHQGDSRGTPWYSDLICLAVDLDTNKVRAKQ